VNDPIDLREALEGVVTVVDSGGTVVVGILTTQITQWYWLFGDATRQSYLDRFKFDDLNDYGKFMGNIMQMHLHALRGEWAETRNEAVRILSQLEDKDDDD